jgi:hypothetical protein
VSRKSLLADSWRQSKNDAKRWRAAVIMINPESLVLAERFLSQGKE